MTIASASIAMPFVGRSVQLEAFAALLARRAGALRWCGPSARGKTALLAQLEVRARAADAYVAYVSLADCLTPLALLDRIVAAIADAAPRGRAPSRAFAVRWASAGYSESQVDEALAALRAALAALPPLGRRGAAVPAPPLVALLLDDVDLATPAQLRIIDALAAAPALVLVCAGRTPIGHDAELLPPLDRSDVALFARNAGCAAAYEALWHATGGEPLLLQLACQLLQLPTEQATDDWPQLGDTAEKRAQALWQALLMRLSAAADGAVGADRWALKLRAALLRYGLALERIDPAERRVRDLLAPLVPGLADLGPARTAALLAAVLRAPLFDATGFAHPLLRRAARAALAATEGQPLLRRLYEQAATMWALDPQLWAYYTLLRDPHAADLLRRLQGLPLPLSAHMLAELQALLAGAAAAGRDGADVDAVTLRQLELHRADLELALGADEQALDRLSSLVAAAPAESLAAALEVRLQRLVLRLGGDGRHSSTFATLTSWLHQRQQPLEQEAQDAPAQGSPANDSSTLSPQASTPAPQPSALSPQPSARKHIRLLLDLGQAELAAGPDLAIPHFARAQTLAREADDATGEAAALFGLAQARVLSGDYHTALLQFATAHALASQANDGALVVATLLAQGDLCRLQGDYLTAARHYRVLLDAAASDVAARVAALRGLAQVDLAHNDLVAAAAHLRQTCDLVLTAGDPTSALEVLLELGQVAALSDDDAAGEQAFGAAQQLAAQQGDVARQAAALLGLGDIALAQRPAAAAQHYGGARRLLAAVDDPWLRACALFGLGRALHLTSRHHEALPLLDAALAAYEALGEPHSAASAALELCRLHLDARHVPLARDAYARLLAIIERAADPHLARAFEEPIAALLTFWSHHDELV